MRLRPETDSKLTCRIAAAAAKPEWRRLYELQDIGKYRTSRGRDWDGL